MTTAPSFLSSNGVRDLAESLIGPKALAYQPRYLPDHVARWVLKHPESVAGRTFAVNAGTGVLRVANGEVTFKPKCTVPRVTIDDDLRMMDMQALTIQALQFDGGSSVSEDHRGMVNAADCAPCATRRAEASLRVWIQAKRNIDRKS